MAIARRFHVSRATTLVALLALVTTTAAQPATSVVTIKEVMELTITPATNTMWNVPERPTDEQWAALEQASITLLVAADVIARGGAGERDAEWVKSPAWAAFNEAMAEAGLAALKAIRARDSAALLAAGDVLYPPCEGCHLQFNPGVVAGE